MPISWNEIRHNAIDFAHEWSGARSEAAEKQSFWDEFFKVFGLRRRTVATFEESVKKITGDYAYIDLLWPSMVLVEHKSRGSDLGKAQSQAFRYIQDLLAAGRQDEVPRYVIVSDFARIALHDLEPEEQQSFPLLGAVKTVEFALADFHQHIHDFAFIPGYKQHRFEDQDPINLKAVAILGDLHDTLDAGGYEGHELEQFLVRILFCLFAEDTGIFEREAFRLYLENRTQADGSDLGPHLARLFGVLNTAPEDRQTNLDETLAEFPYVNGELFAEKLGFADFNRDMRNALLACTRFDWSCISPAIFGSLFQAVMEPRDRRQIGGHYTSERDILKVIRPLFLDDLREEFRRIGNNKAQLRRFHQKLAALRFLDPACGCGNFLVITYRELRLLEIELLQALKIDPVLELKRLSLLDVDAFYGIEISEWPARIAEVAMWLMDHQMNTKLSETFGQLYRRLPLVKSPTIACGNALRLDWNKLLPPKMCSYVLGNPPFVGKQFMDPGQNEDMRLVCGLVKGHGLLDYVTAWYVKAAAYIQGTRCQVAFVSTSSISQGEQVGILWETLFKQGIKIHFAHGTFPWESEAKGKAHVHVVIIGFGAFDAAPKRLYEYEAESAKPAGKASAEEPIESVATFTEVGNISPYLVAGSDVVLRGRSKPLCPVPEIVFGSMPNDGGFLLFSRFGREAFLREQPDAAKYLRRFVGAEEFLNGTERWCLWLHNESVGEFRRMPAVMDCVHAVAIHRRASKRETTKELANAPAYFAEIRQPDTRYLLIPSVSSERRRYIPIGFLRPDVIASNLVLLVPGAELYHFGVLSSMMHMAWVRRVGGRLESRYRYSNRIVYNNFPWPTEPSEAKRARVEEAAQRILDLRIELGDGRLGFLPTKNEEGHSVCLADLYDREGMPLSLYKAHLALDRAVDRCYRPQRFETERQRVEFLFALYEKLTAPLMPPTGKKRTRQ
jgi:hypothetical protein